MKKTSNLDRVSFHDCLALNFRSLPADESGLVLRMRNHPSVRKWMENDKRIEPAEHRRFLAGLRPESSNQYFLVKRGDAALGVVSLSRLDLRNRNAYLGIYKNPYRKEPGAGGSLMEFLKYIAFGVLKLHSLRLEVIESNVRAIDFYLRHGFAPEGRLREYFRRDGRWQDYVVMGLVAR